MKRNKRILPKIDKSNYLEGHVNRFNNEALDQMLIFAHIYFIDDNMSETFRPARIDELEEIWGIIKHAISRRKADGSNQWQDGYPNPAILKKDIEKKEGFILTNGSDIIGYAAVMINDEPQYDDIDGKWLSTGDFVVYHRVAIAREYLGKGFAKKLIAAIHEYAEENNIYSVKADTNFDNPAMMSIFEALGYKYCGGVMINGSPRRAYEKLLS